MAFNLGPLHDAQSRFQRDFADFSNLWSAVRENWRDQRCEKFQREHLSTLGPSLNRFCTALHEFCDEARKADRILADEDRLADERL
jgi:hypothetical protein